jgi:putative transposase
MADAQDSLSQVQEKGRQDSFTVDASGRPLALGGTRLKLPTIGCVST